MGQFLRFCLVGTVGFVVDTAILYLLAQGMGLDLYTARIGSYLGAATVTWLFNRRFTFQAAAPPSMREWGAYLLANSLGAAVNYGIYALCIGQFPAMRAAPVFAVAAGSIAGLAFNFGANRFVIFGRIRPR